MKLCKFPDGSYVALDQIAAVIPRTVHSPHGPRDTLLQFSTLILSTGIELKFDYSPEKVIGFIRTQTKDLFS